MVPSLPNVRIHISLPSQERTQSIDTHSASSTANQAGVQRISGNRVVSEKTTSRETASCQRRTPHPESKPDILDQSCKTKQPRSETASAAPNRTEPDSTAIQNPKMLRKMAASLNGAVWGGSSQPQESNQAGERRGNRDSFQHLRDQPAAGVADVPPSQRVAAQHLGQKFSEHKRGPSSPSVQNAHENISPSMEDINKRSQQNVELQRVLQTLRTELSYKNHLENSLNETIRNSSKKMADLEKQNQYLMHNLEKCKERILAMQPVQGMADNELKDTYSRLCTSINYWVEIHFGDTDNLIASLLSVPDSRNTQNVVKCWRHHTTGEVRFSSPDMDLMKLEAIISHVLHDRLLRVGKVFPGLDIERDHFLREILDEVGRLTPAKHPEMIEMWRVDLQRALASLKCLKKGRELIMERITASTVRCLEDVRSMELQGSVEASQCRQFVQEAADLADNIRQSLELYDFEYPLQTSHGTQKILRLDDLKLYQVVDIGTGAPLRSTASPIPGPDGRVAEVLLVVHPAFVRKATESRSKIVLVKPKIVARFDRPVPRGAKGKASR